LFGGVAPSVALFQAVIAHWTAFHTFVFVGAPQDESMRTTMTRRLSPLQLEQRLVGKPEAGPWPAYGTKLVKHFGLPEVQGGGACP